MELFRRALPPGGTEWRDVSRGYGSQRLNLDHSPICWGRQINMSDQSSPSPGTGSAEQPRPPAGPKLPITPPPPTLRRGIGPWVFGSRLTPPWLCGMLIATLAVLTADSWLTTRLMQH